MGVKEGYKQTEVGVIPEDWECVELGDCIEYIKGYPFKSKDYRKSGTRIIRVSDTTSDSISDETSVYVNNDRIKEFSNWKLYENDIVLSTVGSKPPMYDSLVGKAILINIKYAGSLLNQNAVILRSKGINNRLIHANLKRPNYIKHIVMIFRGNANQASLTLEDLFQFKFSVPTNMREQKAIATALSDIDGLINSLTKLIEKKKNIKHGAMQELLTGKKRLDGFSGEWVETHLGEVGKCLRGVSFEGSADLYVTDNDNSIRLLRANNIYDASINKNDLIFVKSERVADKQIMKPYDILLCMASGSKELVGKSGLFKDNDGHVYTFGAFMGCFRTDASLANPVYIYYLTQSDLYKKYIAITLSGSSINNLKPSNIETMLFSVPQYKEQTAIATILSDMDTEIETLQAKLKKYKAIKQGMMQELLTGRIRLLEGA